jgi:glutathionylspermidine synthase
MKRIAQALRPNWRQAVEAIGFTYHTIDGDLYWDESGFFEFSYDQIQILEQATNVLHAMCLEAVEVAIEEDRLAEFYIPDRFHQWIKDSWENDQPTLFGRFDLAWDGQGPPKLLEYNADTPTSLFEAAVVQWHWLEDIQPTNQVITQFDQFNSLHDQLIDAWKFLKQNGWDHVHFAATPDHEEDFGNITYLRDTAAQAGIDTQYLDMPSIGFDHANRVFVDAEGNPIQHLFKLYPWEWMLQEEFSQHLLHSSTIWLEPPWKMLLSNKTILAILWELFPNHKYLLPASFEPLDCDFVRKPILSREGSNISIVSQQHDTSQSTDGPYWDQPCVYQAYHPLFHSPTGYAVLGSWIIGDRACGLGIREDIQPITHNTSRFVPHRIRRN